MTVIQPPGVQRVVNLLQLKLGYACEIFTPRVQSQETNMFFLGMSYGLTDCVIKNQWYYHWHSKEIFLEN
jgi:hypothetical protein